MSTEVCRSALFVDFDNVFIGLNRQEPELARRFAGEPGRWVEWLQRGLQIPVGSWLSPTRRILVRRCYLNPQAFWGWRPYFIRDAFETIDCPPLTKQGKTSADVHMVLDIVDFLSEGAHIDEFIILSADADFTPVLLKLRKYDRRSIVLAIGPSSSSYTTASDLVIDQVAFLEFLASGDVEPTTTPETTSQATLVRPPSEQYGAIAKTIREIVARSSSPVSLAALADGVRSRHPDVGPDWAGHASFSALLADLNLSGLSRAFTGPGYLYDPDRHVAPATDATKVDLLVSENPRLREVAKRVSDLTGAPYLPPSTYSELFEIIAKKINEDGYQMTRTSKAVRDEAYERHLAVSRQSVNFVLQGITYSGHRLGKADEVAGNLASAFRRNVLNLCARNQVDLAQEDEQLVTVWLLGSDAHGEGQRMETPETAESQPAAASESTDPNQE